MSNLLVKHGRAFSPTKLRNQSKIRTLVAAEFRARQKQRSQSSSRVTTKEHDRKCSFYRCFWTGSDEKPEQPQLRCRGLDVTAQHEAFSPKGLLAAEFQNYRFRG